MPSPTEPTPTPTPGVSVRTKLIVDTILLVSFLVASAPHASWNLVMYVMMILVVVSGVLASEVALPLVASLLMVSVGYTSWAEHPRDELAERRVQRRRDREAAAVASGEAEQALRRREPPPPLQRYAGPFINEGIVLGASGGLTLVVLGIGRAIGRRRKPPAPDENS